MKRALKRDEVPLTKNTEVVQKQQIVILSEAKNPYFTLGVSGFFGRPSAEGLPQNDIFGQPLQGGEVGKQF